MPLKQYTSDLQTQANVVKVHTRGLDWVSNSSYLSSNSSYWVSNSPYWNSNSSYWGSNSGVQIPTQSGPSKGISCGLQNGLAMLRWKQLIRSPFWNTRWRPNWWRLNPRWEIWATILRSSSRGGSPCCYSRLWVGCCCGGRWNSTWGRRRYSDWFVCVCVCVCEWRSVWVSEWGRQCVNEWGSECVGEWGSECVGEWVREGVCGWVSEGVCLHKQRRTCYCTHYEKHISTWDKFYTDIALGDSLHSTMMLQCSISYHLTCF